jgi:hypothetical protein
VVLSGGGCRIADGTWDSEAQGQRTGSVPGIAASKSATWLLGCPPTAVGALEKSLLRELTWGIAAVGDHFIRRSELGPPNHQQQHREEGGR